MGIGRLSALFGLVLAAVLTGCSSSSPGAPTAEPAPLPPDQIVFTVSSGPGYSPTIMFPLQSPAIAIYGDGRILQMGPRENYDLPGDYSVTTVDPAAVARFVGDAEAGGLISESTDAGHPQITDHGNTTFTLHGEGEQSTLSVYAYSSDFDGGLTDDQKMVRARLRDLVDGARSLADGHPSTDFIPEQVGVFELDTGGDPPATTRWPGPAPAGFLTGRSKIYGVERCGVLRGPDAAQVYWAALTNRGADWLIDGATRILVVNPLPVGTVSCDAAA
ncbi:hypothetical protein [Williamsia soli]|uniref:hypothetical protein n=1 Tax=Williamsia soli TaxID=364929 RepID=UPI001A9DB313|nr:hypothetical protein [Williamsia soli]